jgi:hypothetical protein
LTKLKDSIFDFETPDDGNFFVQLNAETTADQQQVGGTHYKDMGIQPWAVMQAVLTHDEWIGYLKGNVIKYGMRQGKKDSDDANKAKHYAKKLAEELRKGFKY